MQRAHLKIDGTITLDTFNDPSIKDIVVFIHGIFGDADETWGDTRLQLISSPIFASFDHASYGYASNAIELKDPQIFVGQLMAWMRAYTLKYESIYFVAHSMGGLFVRHAVANLLSHPDDKDLVRRIKRVFLVASPLAGASAARWLKWVPLLKRINKRIGYLAKPEIDGQDMSQGYKSAADKFVLNGGSKADVPIFHHFVGVRDAIVSSPKQQFYTEFDKDEGAIEGTHATLKEDRNANSVLIRRITLLIQDSALRSEATQRARIEMVRESTRKREQATEATAKGGVASSAAVGARINVLLMSCSATKSDASGTDHPKKNGIINQVEDPRLAKVVLEMRSRVLRLIQEGKIDGIEFKEGNRAAKPSNQKLIIGPDFGGVFNDRRYLAAYLRYTGRCYQASAAEWEAMYTKHSHPQMLIMSGLYGLIPATEFIQNYDVHLTDVDLEASISVQTYWKDRELMTQILIANLEWVEKTRGPIGCVIDALSELSYQETINWSLIDRRWNVMHRVFEARAGRHALENLGVWLRDVIRSPTILDSLEADRFYENANFHGADRIAFENQIGRSTLPVARQIDS
jgi:pimeloyl-ACP methyl ester carboxylesterase